MSHYQMRVPSLAGFLAQNDAKKDEIVKVLVKSPLITSDNPEFHIFMEQITSLFFSSIQEPVELVFRFLILIHKDNTADIYINDFTEIAKAKVNRNVKAGEKITKKDISDISGLKFPDITIDSSDAIIYMKRVSYKFGLFFDFTHETDLTRLEIELGHLLNELHFQSFLKSAQNEILSNNLENTIFSEGASDVDYIQKALTKLGKEIKSKFYTKEETIGESNLLRLCEMLSKVGHKQKIIVIFDRDVSTTVKRLESMTESGKDYQIWGNNIYSFLIPIPNHREQNPNISIEFYFTDDEIKTKDANNRRLYLSNEFNRNSGRHNVEDAVCKDMNKIKSNIISIIDNDVYDNKSINVALPKSKFAEYIRLDHGNFSEFKFGAFEKIFNIISEIESL